MCADHGWRPSTVVGYRSVAGFLTRDPLGGRRAVDLTPKVLVAACADWRSQGVAGPDGLGTDAGVAICARVGLHRTDPGPASLGRDAQPTTRRRADARTGGPRSGDSGVRQAAGNRRGEPSGAEPFRPGGPASGRADNVAHPAGG